MKAKRTLRAVLPIIMGSLALGLAVVSLNVATYDVLRRAAQQGCNLVITHEPTSLDGNTSKKQEENLYFEFPKKPA